MSLLLDTSVLIAQAEGAVVPDFSEHAAISVMSLAELHYGVHSARDEAERAQRIKTLTRVQSTMGALPFDNDAAALFGELAAAVRRKGRKPRIADLVIAATARRNGMTLVTRDAWLAEVPGIDVRKI